MCFSLSYLCVYFLFNFGLIFKAELWFFIEYEQMIIEIRPRINFTEVRLAYITICMFLNNFIENTNAKNQLDPIDVY